MIRTWRTVGQVVKTLESQPQDGGIESLHALSLAYWSIVPYNCICHVHVDVLTHKPQFRIAAQPTETQMLSS